jgi:hypothetical protein
VRREHEPMLRRLCLQREQLQRNQRVPVGRRRPAYSLFNAPTFSPTKTPRPKSYLGLWFPRTPSLAIGRGERSPTYLKCRSWVTVVGGGRGLRHGSRI